MFYYPRRPHTGVYYIRIVCVTTSFTPAIGVENCRCVLYLADTSLRAHHTSLFFWFYFFYTFVFIIFLYR